MVDVLGTISHKIYVARLEADEDASPLDLTTAGDFASKPAGALDLFERSVFTVEKQITPVRPVLVPNGIEFFFSGGSAAGKTFTWKIYAWRYENGPARYVATGTGILGTQAVVKYPHNGETATSKFWCDEIDITWENWLKEIEATDSDGNSNSVGSVWMDAAGYRYWHVVIADADGSTGTEAGDIAVWYGYF